VRTVVALVAGAAAGALLWPALRPTLALPLFERENYRAHRLPVAAGLVVVLATLGVAGAWLVVLSGWDDERAILLPNLVAAAAAVLGFGLLGLLDDLVGSSASRGFGGHLRALSAGELTTGIVKLLGGAVVAVVAVSATGTNSLGSLLAGAAVVALAANLGNLFDRAPGRVEKVTLVGFAVAAVALRDDVALAGPAIAVGCGVVMLVPDLREQCMLGDTGANVLGAAVGLAVAASVGTLAAVVVAGLLAALNAASEWVSFSRVIDKTPPLRWADRLGAPHRSRE
jgi:UDP-GlcNAc:undecaprenyl-phosphate GlcNAc-1-phosphate transferase